MKTLWAVGGFVACLGLPVFARATEPTNPTGAASSATAIASPPPVAGADKFVPVFAPLRSARAALSLDGQRVAYTLRHDDKTGLLIAPSANPTVPEKTVLIGRDEDATPMLGQKEDYPLRIFFLGWFDDQRLVLATNAFSAGRNRMVDTQGGEILGIDADGRNARTLFTPADSETVLEVGLSTAERGLVRTPAPEFKTSSGTGRIVLPTPEKSAAEYTRDRDSDPEQLLGPAFPEQAVQLPELPEESVRTVGYAEVIDLRPGERDVMLVKAGAGARHRIYRVNVRSGKKLGEKNYEIDQDYVPMLDHSGRPRIGIPWSERTPYPWALRYDLSATGRDASRDLAAVLPEPARSHLALTAGNFFGERVLAMGFEHDPALFYYASNVGQDAYAIYSANLTTGQPSAVELVIEGVDLARRSAQGFGATANLVFDRHRRQLAGVRYGGLRGRTLWIDPELQELQQKLEESFPGQNVEIQEWDVGRRRFLMRTHGPVDADAFHLFDRETQTLREFAWNLPANIVADARRHRTFTHQLVRENGATIDGRLVVPRAARVQPLPVLVVCPSEPMEAFSPQFDPELVAFAEMGFAVLEVNPRGTDGFGLKRLHAIMEGYGDGQIDDVLAMVDCLAERYRIDPKRVAITGQRYGGYLALRAVQLHPERFRSALARDPWIDVRDELKVPAWSEDWERTDAHRRRWYFGSEEHLARVSLFTRTTPLARPALIVGDSRLAVPAKAPTDRYRAARRLVAREQQAGANVDWHVLDVEELAQLPRARARLFARFEEFLNLSLYDFGVKLGGLEEVSDAATTP